MTWKIEFVPAVAKELTSTERLPFLAFLHERIAPQEDPRSIGHALHGSTFGEFWRYRVGDWRIIVKIQDDKLTILVLRIGHRSTAYRNPVSR